MSLQHRDPLIGVLDYIAEVSPGIHYLSDCSSILPAISGPGISYRA
jgi:hypothetical protein